MRKLVFACMVLALSSCAGFNAGRPGGVTGEEPQIRVLLDEGRPDYRLGCSGGVVVAASGVKIAETTGAGSVSAGVRGSTLNLSVDPGGQLVAAEGEVTVAPRGESLVEYGGVRYPGVIKLITTDRGEMALLNVVPLETYLEGVLPHEIGNPGPDGYDAVKTQAIAARTYAMRKMQERRTTYFDVYASVMDQVYRGVEGRNRLTSSAIGDTRGRVIDHRGEAVKAYYSACCGGHTSDIRQVWPEREPADYLHGVSDRDPLAHQSFCRDNRYFRWRYSFTGRELGDVLRKTISKERGISEREVGALVDIRADERSASGRVTALTIVTTKNTFTFVGDRIRWILMRDVSDDVILPSVMFQLDKVMEGGKIAFVSISGGGNGHGVGMCQNGAIAMARKGYNYEMILAHYYPGCTVARRY